MSQTRKKPQLTPKSQRRDDRFEVVEISLETNHWKALLYAAELVQRRRARTAGNDPEEELRDQVRASAIEYLRRVTETEAHTSRVRMVVLGCSVLLHDAVENINEHPGIAVAGRALTVAASAFLFTKEGQEDSYENE